MFTIFVQAKFNNIIQFLPHFTIKRAKNVQKL